MRLKPIKFDLPINGIKAKTLDELRDHLGDELLTLARSGQLGRWLINRQHDGIEHAVAAAVATEADDKALFLALCQALEVEVHPDDVAALFDSFPAGRRLQQSEPAVASDAARIGFEQLLEFSLNNFCSWSDGEALIAIVNAFDQALGRPHGVHLEFKEFAWKPNVWVKKDDRVARGDLIASVRNQKMLSPVAGTVRAIGGHWDSVAVLIEVAQV